MPRSYSCNFDINFCISIVTTVEGKETIIKTKHNTTSPITLLLNQQVKKEMKT